MNKFCGAFFRAGLRWSPFDVVAWHGNYAPCRYELARFATVNTVSFDHPDPSIFTVTTPPLFASFGLLRTRHLPICNPEASP